MKTKKKVAVLIEDQRKEALLDYLKDNDNDLSIADIKEGFDDKHLEWAGSEYMVLTDEEADEMAKDSILESAWAFNKSFLESHSDVIGNIDKEGWEAITARCESSNSAVLAMIRDTDHFVEDAIRADGRGHFMNTYDGNEDEGRAKDGTLFFIYRIS